MPIRALLPDDDIRTGYVLGMGKNVRTLTRSDRRDGRSRNAENGAVPDRSQARHKKC